MTSVAPRLLAVMGSGETAPTMVKTHRALLARFGPPPVPAVLLDTPFGFQENADDLVARAREYFRQSVGHDIDVATYRSAADASTVDADTLVARVREARYVFAGPGSPSYALRQWAGSPLPGALREKLERGGCVCFASAAALTLGAFTVPVYEIYKVGETPAWLDGLDLMRAVLDRPVAVIPHYNNAEGGTHDTRYCYLGERRLRVLEADLPDDGFVLGVDEHTALVLDLDAGSAAVEGLGVVTVREAGASRTIAAGTTVALGDLAKPTVGAQAPFSGPEHRPREPEVARSPLLETAARCEAAFDAALDRRDGRGAVAAILELDEELRAWSADSLQSDEPDRARATLRSMIVRLGERADVGLRDPAEALAPLVEGLLELRTAARTERRWADADAIRDVLLAAGVEVNDGPEGSGWRLLS